MAQPEVTVKVSDKIPKCGFCTWPSHMHGSHELDARLTSTDNHCPVGVANGDGITIYKCTCACSVNLIRCLDCGLIERFEDRDDLDPKAYNEWLTERATSEHEVNPATWRCYDPAECAAKIERRLAADPLIQMIRSFQANAEKRVARERAERPSSSRPTSGKCLHCGEPTKGGMFLPGHDAAFLAAAVQTISAGDATLGDVLNTWTGLGVSEALRGKLEKRAA